MGEWPKDVAVHFDDEDCQLVLYVCKDCDILFGIEDTLVEDEKLYCPKCGKTQTYLVIEYT